MRSISTLRLAFLFAGSFLGAGFVSGQELWQYFGVHGSSCYLTLAISLVLFFLMGLLVLFVARLSGLTKSEELVCPWPCTPVRASISLLFVLQLVAVVIIMTAAVGALFSQLFAIPAYVGAAFFILLVFAVSFFNLEGVLAAFSVSVPLLIVSVMVFCGKALTDCHLALPAMETLTTHSSLWDAVNYTCFNMLASIAILAPFAEFLPSRRTLVAGVGLGSIAIGVIACCVLLCLQVWQTSVSAQLPMLEAASNLGSVFRYLYAFLLLAAMFGTSLSSFVALARYLETKLSFFSRRKLLCSSLICLVSFGASLFGFRELISVIYPVFGYAGAVCIVLMLIHLILLKRQHKTFS